MPPPPPTVSNRSWKEKKKGGGGCFLKSFGVEGAIKGDDWRRWGVGRRVQKKKAKKKNREEGRR